MQQKLSFEEFKEILSKIKYKNWELIPLSYDDCFVLQWAFYEKDVTQPKDLEMYNQKCRKWFISKHSTPTEIIRTAWLAVQQAEIHEASESFTYNDVRLFDPHTNYIGLSEYMASATQDIRK